VIVRSGGVWCGQEVSLAERPPWVMRKAENSPASPRPRQTPAATKVDIRTTSGQLLDLMSESFDGMHTRRDMGGRE
jgi:hypothetical protein